MTNLVYLWVWGLICNLAFTESAPENLSTTKTGSNNYFVNKYEFFKSTPMIFLSTSTANENSHQHQLQPITMYIIDFSYGADYFSYITPYVISTGVKWLPLLRQRPLNVVSEILKLAWARFRSGTSFLGFWFDTVPRIDPVQWCSQFECLSVLLPAEKHFNIVQTFKMFKKETEKPKTNEGLARYWTILFLKNA